jgi:hypothetical protein
MALKKLTDSNEQLDAILRCLNYWSNKVDEINRTKVDGIEITRLKLDCNHDDFRTIEKLIYDLIEIEKSEINTNTLKLALEYLIYENLVKFDICYKHNDVNGYRILFKGKVFIENGGYTQKYINELYENKRLENIETHQKQMAEKQNHLTLFLVLLSAALLIWDIIKYCLENNHDSINYHFHLF